MKRSVLVFLLVISSIFLISCTQPEIPTNNLTISGEDFNNLDLQYIVDQIVEPEIIDVVLDVKKDMDGNFLLLGYKYEIKKNSKGEEIKFTEHKVLLIDKEGHLVDEFNLENMKNFNSIFTISENRYIYTILENPNDEVDSKEQVRTLTIYDLSGQIIREVPKILDPDNKMANGKVRKIKVDKDERIYALNSSGTIEAIDNDCITVNVIEVENQKILDFDIDSKGNIILVTHDVLKKIDPITNEVVYKHQIEMNLSSVNLFYDNSENLLYSILNHSELYVFDNNGNPTEKIFDLTKITYFKSIISFYKIDEDYYINAWDSRNKLGPNFYSLKEARELNVLEDTLVIASNVNNTEKFRQIIREFKLFYPDIDISFIDKGDLSSEQFLQNINTELMIGKGPDLFYGDFPYQYYMEKDMLLDLNQYISSSERYRNGEYHNNIIEAMKYNEGLFVFPMEFNFLKLYVNNQILNQNDAQFDEMNWTIKDMSDVIDKVCGTAGEQGNYSFHGYFPSNLLLRDIINSNLENMVNYNDNTANFNTEEFRELLLMMKGIVDRESEPFQFGQSNRERIPNALFLSENHYNYSPVNLIEKNTTSLAEDYFVVVPPKWLGTQNIFTASLCGINKNTNKTENAIKFIEYISSEEFGLKHSMKHNFSINKKVNTLNRELSTKGMVEIPEYISIENLELNVSPKSRELTMEDEYLISLDVADKIDNMIDSLNYYNWMDLPIYDEIYSYYDNIQDLDTTINNIQNKVTLYIGE